MRNGRLGICLTIIVAFLCVVFPATAITNEEAAQSAIKQALRASGATDIAFTEDSSALHTDGVNTFAYYTKVDYSINGASEISDATVVMDNKDGMLRLVFLSIDAKYYGYVKESDITLSLNVAKRGDKGDKVKSIQEMLIQLGFLDGTADGVYGAGTEKAVKKFQAANGLRENGIVSPDTYDLLKEMAESKVSAVTEGDSTSEEATSVVSENLALGLIEKDGKWHLVTVNLKTGEKVKTGKSYVFKRVGGVYIDPDLGIWYESLVDKDGQTISVYEDDKLGVYFPVDEKNKAYFENGGTITYHSKHPEFMDARGYIAKGVTLYFEDDEDTLTPLMEVKDIAYNTIKDGIASGYLLKVYDLELKKTYWQDGDFLLNTFAKNAGHPKWYIKVNDKKRRKTEEVIDYEFKGSWRPLRSGIKEGIAVYLGQGQNKAYQFDVVSYNKAKNELYVKYPDGTIELKNYDALVNGRGLYVLD